jgi:hypothetical protein
MVESYGLDSLAGDRDQWRALVNMVMKLRFASDENFLTG